MEEMYMIGTKYRSEMKLYTDPKTGFQVTQLSGGDNNNHHLYFTENSFVKDKNEIVFYSDRASKGERGGNLFLMNLDSGEMTQLSDFSGGISHCIKPPEGGRLFCFHGRDILRIDYGCNPGLEPQVIYTCPEGWRLTSMSLNASGSRIGFVENETVDVPYGNNYTGFTESMYAVKRSRVLAVGIDGSNPAVLFNDTHWMGHFQFAPDDDSIATFCHEGPWNLVQQRIWLIDFISRTVIPCFRQAEDDSVGHEFWTRDDGKGSLVFFDNRRAGHDGTITSDKTQVYKPPLDKQGVEQTPYVGFADKQGRVVRTVDMPFYCNHYHANNDNTILVGDDVEDLQVINIAGEKARMQTLCYHGTSWFGQSTHCHPTFDWEGRRVLFTSDRDGKRNLYLIDTAQVKW
jgi:oligogalacturonide lyase